MNRATLRLSYRSAGITVALRVSVGAQALAPSGADAPPADVPLPAPPDLPTAIQAETLRRMLHTLHTAHLEVQTDLARSSASAIEQSGGMVAPNAPVLDPADYPEQPLFTPEQNAVDDWNLTHSVGTAVRNSLGKAGRTTTPAFLYQEQIPAVCVQLLNPSAAARYEPPGVTWPLLEVIAITEGNDK